jgi:glycosyltransferase involved in cell wall biosynthesis
MRALIATESRYTRTRNGHLYSAAISSYNFWKRYLQVFDEIVIMARVEDSTEESMDKIPADGPGVSFFCLPYYVGAWQYIWQHFKLASMMGQVTKRADVFILRSPGRISTLLWHQLMAEKIPYGVEVLGSSEDVTKTGGYNILVRWTTNLLDRQKEICACASAALYVTENYLQSRYPSRCWSTSSPNADLTEEAIAGEAEQKARIQSIKEITTSGRPVRICHAGTMGNLYKAQDVLFKAVSICLNKGLKMELTLLGDGKCRQYFENKARILGLSRNVSFLGQIPSGQAVRDQLDKAMARGLPCIGSTAGGIPELLESEYLVPPGDEKALADKITEVIRNADRLEKMSKRNLEMSKKYRFTVLNRRRVEFYKKVADLAGSRTS